MRSTPAHMLRQDQLLVDRYDVHKIAKVEYPIPQNVVTVHLTDQMTGEESTRDLRWDQHVTTEEPFEVKIGESGKITVELARQRDEEDHPLYRYKITDESAGIDHEGVDLYLGAMQVPSNTKAARTLLGSLQASADALIEGHAVEADAFPEEVNFWALHNTDEITTARIELGGDWRRDDDVIQSRRQGRLRPGRGEEQARADLVPAPTSY